MNKILAPGYTTALGERIAFAIQRAGGVLAIGRELAVSKDTPGRWRDGESKISLHDIARLAAAARVDPTWLAFGHEAGDPGGAADFDLVEEAAETVIEIALSLNREIDPKQLARTIRQRAERLAEDRQEAAARAEFSNGLTSGRKSG